MTNNMTDEQLCYAISEAREPKPTENPKRFEEAWGNPDWIYDVRDTWNARPWLDWAHAGILLEEMVNDILEIVFGCESWRITMRDYDNIFADKLPRCICEAYLEWKRNETAKS